MLPSDMLLTASAADSAYQVVYNMCSNVMMDLVEDAVVTIQCGQTTTQIAPLLTPVTEQHDRLLQALRCGLPITAAVQAQKCSNATSEMTV